MNQQKQNLIIKINEDILNGSIVRNNQLFSERELCEVYHLKRTQIREALIALETLGIIEIVERQGMFVTNNHKQGLTDGLSSLKAYSPLMLHDQSIEARLIIEPQCAAIAARKCTEKDRDILMSEINIMKSLYQDETKDINEQAEMCYRHNIIMHNTIVNMANNVVLTNIYSYLADLSRNVFSVLGQNPDGFRPYAIWPDELIAEHEKIVQAIVAGDDKGASKAMYTHLCNSQQRNSAMMEERHTGEAYPFPLAGEI